MIEVCKNIFVGDQDDFDNGQFSNEWVFVQAAREPYHRAALGYTGRGAPKDHPDYLFARRENPCRLILNLLDSDSLKYIPKEVIDEALGFISVNATIGCKILIHCNRGLSRSAGIAFLYMAQNGLLREGWDYASSLQVFKEIYPPCDFGRGIALFCEQNWPIYAS